MLCKVNRVSFLLDNISYLWIEEQLPDPTAQEKILDLKQMITNKVQHGLPNAFYDKRMYTVSLPSKKDFMRKLFLKKLGLLK